MENTPVSPVPSRTRKQTNFVLIFILIIICLATLLIAFGFYYSYALVEQNQRADEQKQKIDERRRTPYAATAQANAVGTANHQATQVSEYEFFDDFTNNKNRWLVGSDATDNWKGNISISNGVYVWKVYNLYGPRKIVWRKYDNQPAMKDFDLSVDAKLADPKTPFLCYAVAFRSSLEGFSNGSYIFTVCDDQRFLVKYRNKTKGGTEILCPWGFSDAIRSGDWNTLAVSARGSRFTLSINNVIVFEFTDARLPKGRIYLVLETYDVSPGTIMFDNFGLQTR